MPSKPVNLSAGRALSPGAIALMLMLCLSWGFNQIAVKLVLADVPPMLQALITQIKLLYQCFCFSWSIDMKPFEHVKRGQNIPTRHVVGIGIVIDMLVPFIRYR